MLVTVTQLPDHPAALESAFADLAAHTQAAGSELVLLPEMPFHPWLAASDQPDPAAWQAAVDAHAEWLPRLATLGAGIVLGSQPVLDGNTPHNDAFIWQPGADLQRPHRKYYLPNEPGFWEATWYRRAAAPRFQAAGAGPVKVGFMICSDIWFGEHARGYARQAIHILANPRATEHQSVDKWIAGGRALAVMAGAYCLSANRADRSHDVHWGGAGWIIDPNGVLLATTSHDQPFVTLEIDLALADAAKSNYPRDIAE
jgi:N-carbamoylputrescine amidase